MLRLPWAGIDSGSATQKSRRGGLTMDEYIKREAALAICEEEYREQLRILNYAGDSVAWNIGHAIKELPAADVAPVVYGKWIVRFDGPYNRRRCYCSHCGKHNGVGGIAKNQEKPYCPNCGAKMDGGDSDEADRR